MPRPNVRPRLLEATAALVLRDGVSELTLERAATAAGVSKGGLLYHFPTKAALLGAVVDDVIDRFEQVVDTRAAGDTRPAAWAHAYVDATFDVEVSRPDLAAALLTSPEADPAVLLRCAERLASWQDRLESEGIDAATAAVVRYACDGWWTLGGLGPVPDRDDAAGLRARLHALLRESAR
jgi:AcrR family transcriptional regulator